MKNINQNTSTEKAFAATATHETPAYTIVTADNVPDMDRVTDMAKGSYSALHDIIGECQDNAFSAIIASGIGSHISIRIVASAPVVQPGDSIEFTVRDDGPGIADVHAFMRYGDNSQQFTALNAWGSGPKGIPANSVTVRTTHNGQSYQIQSFAVHAPIAHMNDVFNDLPRGTEMTFSVDAQYLLNEIYRHDGVRGANETNDFATLCSYLEENLGAMFAGTMLVHPEIKVTLRAEHTGKPKHIDEYDVEPLYPVFSTEKTAENLVPFLHKTCKIPAFNKQKGEIELEMTCGQATPNRPSQLGYYRKASDTQKWSIAVMGRIIGYTKDLAGGKAIHPDFNGVMGVVNMNARVASYMPKMRTSKTGFMDQDEKVLHAKIYEQVPGLAQKLNELVGPSEHQRLCRNIINHLEPNPDNLDAQVIPEVNLGTMLKALLDIADYRNGIGYEIKPTKAGLKELLQARCYAEEAATHSDPRVQSLRTIRLCAPSFVKGLKEQADKYNKEMSRTRTYKGYKIELVDIRDVPGANYDEVHKMFSRKK